LVRVGNEERAESGDDGERESPPGTWTSSSPESAAVSSVSRVESYAVRVLLERGANPRLVARNELSSRRASRRDRGTERAHRTGAPGPK